MIEVTKTKNNHQYDEINIKTEEGQFEITFKNNLDLYWSYLYKGNIEEIEEDKIFTITKENYQLYLIFDNLYKKVIEKSKDPKMMFIYNPEKLVQGKIIDWHSDDCIYEKASCIQISKEDEEYQVKFIKSKEEGLFKNFSIRICNSGSRHQPFNVLFMHLYHQLIEYEPNFHQIHIEEILYEMKRVRKK